MREAVEAGLAIQFTRMNEWKAILRKIEKRKQEFLKTHMNLLEKLEQRQFALKEQIRDLYEKYVDKELSREDYLAKKEAFIIELEHIEDTKGTLMQYSIEETGLSENDMQWMDMLTAIKRKGKNITENVRSCVKMIRAYDNEHIEVELMHNLIAPSEQRAK